MLIPNNSMIQFPVVPGFHPVPVIRYRTKHIVELRLYNYILAELESYLVFSFAVKFFFFFLPSFWKTLSLSICQSWGPFFLPTLCGWTKSLEANAYLQSDF